MNRGCTCMYQNVLECTTECTNAEPPCTGMYWYVLVCTGIYRDTPILVYTGMYGYVLFPQSTYANVLVCTFQRKYIPTCTIPSYKSVHTGTYRYIPTYTRCRGFQMTVPGSLPRPGCGPGREPEPHCLAEAQPRRSLRLGA